MTRCQAVLAIDQGTTNSKALLVGPDGSVLGKGSAPVSVTMPGPGQVEQDATELWSSVRRAIAAAQADAPGIALVGVAISNQRESVLAWSGLDGDPVGPVIGWQDARTEDWCRGLAAHHPDLAGQIGATTGLRLDPMFSAPKLRWLLDHTGVDRAGLRLGTVDAWLVDRLTGGTVHAVETGNASRTLLLDLERLDWSADLLDAFGIPGGLLPEVRASDAGFGRTRGVPELPDGLPVLAVLADSHAALFGQGGDRPGIAKATYGTGTSVMVPLDRLDPRRLTADAAVSTTVAWCRDRPTRVATYAREANILSSGAALDWTARLLGCADVAGLIDLAADGDPDTPAQLVPALTGLGAPHWDRSARAGILGMSAATGRADLARAVVNAVAQQVCDVVDEVEAAGAPVGLLRADGGASVAALLMQTQADLLGRPVQVADAAELSALGAARLAWSAHTGEPPWPVGADPEVAAGRTYAPRLAPAVRDSRRTAWRDAVATIRSETRTMTGTAAGTRPGP